MLNYSVSSFTSVNGQTNLSIICRYNHAVFANMVVDAANKVVTLSLTYNVRGYDMDKAVLAAISKLAQKFASDKSLANMLKGYTQVVYHKQIGDFIPVDSLKKAVNGGYRLYTFPKVDFGFDISTYAADEVAALDWLVQTQPDHVKKSFLKNQEIVEGGLATLDDLIELEL